jgi:hypothetical protein
MVDVGDYGSSTTSGGAFRSDSGRNCRPVGRSALRRPIQSRGERPRFCGSRVLVNTPFPVAIASPHSDHFRPETLKLDIKSDSQPSPFRFQASKTRSNA